MKQFIISGFGGQGVMFVGKLLAHAGMLAGKHVTWIPSYGPEMRGGTANCAVVIAEEEIGCPVVSKPDVVVALNRPSVDKFMKQIQPGGIMFVNSSLVNDVEYRKDIEVIEIPANDLGTQLGEPTIGNMVILGALAKKVPILQKSELFNALTEAISTKRKEQVEINEKAIDIGYGYLSKQNN